MHNTHSAQQQYSAVHSVQCTAAVNWCQSEQLFQSLPLPPSHAPREHLHSLCSKLTYKKYKISLGGINHFFWPFSGRSLASLARSSTSLFFVGLLEKEWAVFCWAAFFSVGLTQCCQIAKFDPFISLDCAPRPPPWHSPRKGRDQILHHSEAEP